MNPSIKILLLLFLLGVGTLGLGQNPDIKRTWHWYFGYGAGLDFSSGSPVVDTSSKVRSPSALETSFTLSDTCGNLLLYGYDTIYSKNHNFVYDLDPIINTNTLTQMLAVPQPGNDSIVYIFCSNVIDARLYYVIVNLNLNGGEGDVIFVDTLIGGWSTSPITQKLAAYHHCNTEDIWIITKLGNGPLSKNLYAFLLTTSGLNTTPTISNVVQHPLSGENAGGGIRFSPDGSMMAAAYLHFDEDALGNPDSNFVELYQFNNCTGMFSNPIIWNFQTPNYPVFSPDGSKLYISTVGDFDSSLIGMGFGADSSYIIQYDVSVYDKASILSSQYLMYFPDTLFGQMQLGPDGKIYVADLGRKDIFSWPVTTDSTYYKPGVIQNPNASGAACNYQPDAFNVYRNHWYGFPNFVDSYFRDFYYYECSTGMEDKPEEETILQIFGNPTANYLTLHNPNISQTQLKIFDITGKLIFIGTLPEKSTKDFDVSFMTPGMYIINAQYKNQFINLKFIKL